MNLTNKKMDNKNYLTPLLIVFLTITFAFIGLMVFITNGKSSFWISKKIKIGALLLSLSSVVSFNSCTTSCYDPPAEPQNIVEINNISENNTIILNNIQNNATISGKISECVSSEFSFAVTDKLTRQDTFQKEELIALDGAFDSRVEEFELDIINDLISGEYSLIFFENYEEGSYPIQYFNLKIEN